MPKHKIVLATFGSFGDLHPYLSIAGELRRRGHVPVIATVPYYREKIAAAGFDFHPVRFAEMQEPDTALMRKIFHPRHGPEFIVRNLVLPNVREAYADMLAALDGASLMVSHPLTFAAALVAEQRKLPWLSAHLAPMGLMSAYDPPVLPPAPFLDRWRGLGPAFWKPLLSLGKRSARHWTAPCDSLRSELGLPPIRNAMFEGGASPYGTLAMFSPLLGAPQPDWPRSTVQTGFPFYDGESQALPPGLEDFLQAGEPPIVFTLGSSAVLDAGSFYQESAAAAQTLGRRAVLLVGRDGVNQMRNLPPGTAAFDYAPYSLLFPRAAAIVHQGGVGTTGQAMRSCRPMLVMPYAVDQPDNAARVRRLGIARTIARRSYSAVTAARELDILLREPSYRDRAGIVGQHVANENGAAVAADAIERILA